MAQCYRVLFPLILISTSQEVKVGDIIDLSDKPDQEIQGLLKLGYVETAEGEPVNVAGVAPEGTKKHR